MKIKVQAQIMAFLGLFTIISVGYLILTQINTTQKIALEMQDHQKALIQLNSYQVSAINLILLSVDLIRTGDISGERITPYRMSETRFSREVKTLENLYSLNKDLQPQIENLQRNGTQLSLLCKTELMEPLYSHQPIDKKMIDKLIYDELTILATQINQIKQFLNDSISHNLSEQETQDRIVRNVYLPSTIIILLLLQGTSLFIIFRNLRHINSTGKFLGKLANGESRLDLYIGEKGNDEITYLRKNFNHFIKNLGDRHHSLKKIAASQVNSGEKLSHISLEHSAATGQLEESLKNVNGQTHLMTSHVSSSLEEITNISQALNTLEQLSAHLDDRVSHIAGQGDILKKSLNSQRSAVEQQIKLTLQVKEESQHSQKTFELHRTQIKEILLGSTTIFEAMLSIEDLAEKTDVLAINASIEAAHSGQNGKGFSVVANEMRNLSGQVHNNTDKVTQLLNELDIKLNLMSDEEKNNQESIKRLIKQNERAENAIKDLTASNEKIDRIIGNFFTEIDSVQTKSSHVHKETALVRNSSLRINALMDNLNKAHEEMKRESEEITQGLKLFTHGTALLNNLSNNNRKNSSYLEEEIKKLGS
jgi:methyl-accepting chemotaxis protein